MIRLEFSERMSGSWHRLDSPGIERPIEFVGRATVARMSELLGDTVATLRGRVVAEGLSRGAEFDGTLGLGALWREGRLPYGFSFVGDDGRNYRFDGAKEVTWLDPVRTLSVLPAYLFDDRGNEVGRAVLHFDVRTDFLNFLRSWRLGFAGPSRLH